MLPKRIAISTERGKQVLVGESPQRIWNPPKEYPCFYCFNMPFFTQNMVHNNVLYDSAKILSLAKICHQYLWKESVDLRRGFLHGDNHQRKVACEATSSGWVWPVEPLIQSDCRILWSSISVERIKWS